MVVVFNVNNLSVGWQVLLEDLEVISSHKVVISTDKQQNGDIVYSSL